MYCSGSMKAQAAIEYLMTYGWALLVIAVVISVLYLFMAPYLNTTSCNLESGFLCNKPQPEFVRDASANKIKMNIRLHNTLPTGVTITKIACSLKRPEDITESDATSFSSNNHIDRGSYSDFIGVVCKNGQGNDLSANSYKSGSVIRVNIKVWYKKDEQISDVVFTASGSAVGKVV